MLMRWLTRPLIPAVIAWGALCFFLYLGLDLILMPWVAGRFVKTAEVPKLTGLRLDNAEDSLQSRGLSLKLDSASDFSDLPAGRIMSQFPDPDATVKRGRRIWVRISKGRRAVEIPALRGMSLRQAEISLQQAGLRLGIIHYVPSAEAPAGAVTGSRPVASSTVERGARVGVDISTGADAAVTLMPSLLGLSLTQARNQLSALQLTVGEVTTRADSKNLSQTVISQNPEPGARLKGEPVDLVVSQ